MGKYYQKKLTGTHDGDPTLMPKRHTCAPYS